MTVLQTLRAVLLRSPFLLVSACGVLIGGLSVVKVTPANQGTLQVFLCAALGLFTAAAICVAVFACRMQLLREQVLDLVKLLRESNFWIVDRLSLAKEFDGITVYQIKVDYDQLNIVVEFGDEEVVVPVSPALIEAIGLQDALEYSYADWLNAKDDLRRPH